MKKILVIFICLSILTSCSQSKEVSYKNELELINTYSHNTSSFTQGLFFYNNELYESTGLYGYSKLYKNIDLNNSTYDKEYSFNNDIFAEGSIIYKNKLYVLTWKEHKIFVFNPDSFEVINILNYDKEGWGLTTNGEYLIASDGSNKIYFMDENLNVLKELDVKYNNEIIDNLNELEIIDNNIWANRFMSDKIYIIDINNGEVKKIINFKELNNQSDSENVLNGIAYNNDKIYITGKRWDKIYEFKLK